MTIDLSQFSSKKVTVTFRSGKKITDVLFFNENRVWPYKFWGHTFKKEGNEDYFQSPYDIIHIELAEEPMINLSQFVGKTVIATLRDGEVIEGILRAIPATKWPYKIGYRTFTIDGHNGYDNEPTDIIHIELAEEPMKKYEQLEAQIVKLQEEVERLKKQEKEEEQKDKLPYHFSRGTCLSFLKNTKLLGLLCGAFNWQSTPQGVTHWREICRNGKRLTDADIIQIQKWVIMSFEQEFGK